MHLLREWIHRLVGTVRPGRRDADLEEELRLHAELAAEEAGRRGVASQEAGRTARLHVGGVTQAMEAMRDQRGWPWLQSLSSDVVFAWRQLRKHRTASLAAILSLGLAVGATTTAFRLMNAVLWRTLPVAEPDRLFVLGWNATTSQGETEYRDEFDYPTFRRYAELAQQHADLMVVGMTGQLQAIVFDGATEPDRVTRQYVSGNVFPTFGMQPALGRLLTRSDDVTPGAHPVAVIGYDYWTRRFARDPDVLGTMFRLGPQSFEIVGVTPRGFTGTEPGRVTDVFIPATMNVRALDRPGFEWFRVWLQPRTGVSPEQARQPLQAEFMREHREQAARFGPDMPRLRTDRYLSEQLQLVPAGNGASDPQRNLRRPLLILSGLVALVLLIACANVANLLTAQAMARTREMALRVSIGAGRARLIQLVMIESLLLAVCASVAGAVFAWWAAPFVVSLVDLGQPLDLVLDIDWRTIVFSLTLTTMVTALFGLAPALRASSVEPLGGLKGSDDAQSRRRLTRTLIGAQMTFCVFVLFTAGLLVATFANLSNRPLGFEYERLLLVDALTGAGQSPQTWTRLIDQLRSVPGVESVAQSMWPPLSQNRWTATVRVPGRTVVQNPVFMLGVSPEYFETMGVGMIDGRTFRPGDTPPRLDDDKRPLAGVGIINEAMARVYFNGENPIGKRVSVANAGDEHPMMEIIAVVRDSAYYSVREPMRPIAYVPLEEKNTRGLVIRASGDPVALAPAVRRDLSRLQANVRATSINPFSELVRRQMVLERLLAILSLFFAVVALLLAGIGLYGVLNYAVIQRRREIGVRMALGARAAHVVRRVTSEMLSPVGAGTIVGLAAGLAFGRLIETILFEVKATDVIPIATPLIVLAAAACLVALPPALRAVRTDPAQTLRSE